MKTELTTLLSVIVNSSTAGAGGMAARPTIKGFALPRHGADMNAIDRHMLSYADRREDAITRVLGLRFFTANHNYTTVGVEYLSKCVNKKRIIQNQFKKWHFAGPLNIRDKEAKSFDIYPYWIVLEFLCLIKSLESSLNISTLDFLIFIVSIRKRSDIRLHVEACIIAKKTKTDYDDFLKNIPKETSAKFIAGHWNQVLENGFFEYIEYDTASNIISLSALYDCSELEEQVDTFYYNYSFSDYNSDKYNKFLQTTTGDKMIFPHANISQEDIKASIDNIDNQFTRKNILLKGVPGTGKSTLLSNITNNKIFKLKDESEDGINPCLSKESLLRENVLRINIHSASSNADLMQGIGIATDTKSNIIYTEKRGLIFKHIEKACFSPSLPFVLILEEIQENSLNELIGDLIYLIELSKRAKIQTLPYFDTTKFELKDLINYFIENIKDIHYVELPNLIDPTKTQRMIFPDNLYVFCTSNYRDDKKVIEDNLLRRFHVIELYPQYDNFELDNVGTFLECLNNAILQVLQDDEIHEDRFLIGHTNWINIKKDEEKIFFQSLLKFFIEFKEIREIEFDVVQNILEVLNKCDKINKIEEDENWAYKLYRKNFDSIKDHSYKAWIDTLQEKVYKDIIDLQREQH